MQYSLFRICLLASFALLLVGKCLAQNIVPDPGFEGWTGSNNGGNTLEGMTDWYNANGTSDLHHTSRNPGSNLTGLNPCPLGQGDSSCGTAVAGEGVMGCYKGNGDDGSKEWAGTRLTEPMVAGDCYEVSFWIQNKRDDPSRENVTNRWGVFFSETMQPQFNPNLFDFNRVVTQWVATEEIIDGSDWRLIELNFEADAAYEYLFVGFMGNVADANHRLYNNSPNLGCYVFFDELYVRHVDVEVPPTINICAGESTTIDLVSDYALRWTDGTVSDTTRSFAVNPLVTTTYYVTATGNNGCTKTDSVTVVVDFSTNTVYPDRLCNYSVPVVVDAATGPGRWVGPGITDETTGRFDPVLAGPGEHTVYFLSNEGCAASGSYQLTVQNFAPPELLVDAVEGCTPLTVTAEEGAITTPGITYAWTFGDTTITSAAANASYTFNGGGEYVVSATITYFQGCAVTTTLPTSIVVNQSPVADFSTTPVRLTNLEGAAVFEDRSEGDVIDWYWDIAGLANDNRPEARYDFTEAGDYEVLLEVADGFGCTDSIRKTITVSPDARIYIPNAFSPNFDGINDRFELGIAGQLADFQLEIYNRWGGLVFQSTDPEMTWDGRGRNGEPAAVGTYLYSISYRLPVQLPDEEHGKRTIHSNLILLR